MKAKCQCGKSIESKYSEKEKLHFFHCSDCKIGGKGKTEQSALENFNAEIIKTQSMQLAPKSKDDFLPWVTRNMPALRSQSAAFQDTPATDRMIEKNMRYIAKADLKNAWSTVEGRESIIEAMNDAHYYGATLPEMGSIVPFKDVVEFIPAVSAFQFALTTGENAPFTNINIDALHENDQYEISRDDGNFHFKIKSIGMPRGEVVGVVVQATRADTGKIIGEAYDEPRLMQKAARHSTAYKYFLNDLEALRKAQSEGKDFIEKKPGWKITERDLVSPYDGPDKPEMLKKLAGKSYLAPYMKIRNAVAIAGEKQETEKPSTPLQAVKASIKAVQKDISDAEYTIDEEPEREQQETPKADGGLFGDDL
jgi:hypothetical protein